MEVYRAIRAKNNIIKPWRPDTNDDNYVQAVCKELMKPGTNLGLGIDCSDSLLYEGVSQAIKGDLNLDCYRLRHHVH